MHGGTARGPRRGLGNRLRAAPLALLLCTLLLAGGVARAEVVEEIVARVNDQIITLSDLREREERVVGDLFERFSGEELERRVREARSTLLRDLIRESLLLQRAETLGLDTARIVEVSLEQIKQQNNIKTNEEMLRILREQGTTLEELRQQILRMNVPAIMLDREVRQKVGVSDAEIEAHYKEHVEEHRVPETVVFGEIVLRVDEEEDEEAERARAGAALAELEGGAPFEAVVEKYSEAPSREVKGRIGPINPEELARPIERALRAIEPGALSPVVQSRYGFHILKLEERSPARQKELQEVRSAIEDKIRSEKTGAALEAYFERLRHENFIHVSAAYSQYGAP